MSHQSQKVLAEESFDLFQEDEDIQQDNKVEYQDQSNKQEDKDFEDENLSDILSGEEEDDDNDCDDDENDVKNQDDQNINQLYLNNVNQAYFTQENEGSQLELQNVYSIQQNQNKFPLERLLQSSHNIERDSSDSEEDFQRKIEEYSEGRAMNEEIGSFHNLKGRSFMNLNQYADGQIVSHNNMMGEDQPRIIQIIGEKYERNNRFYKVMWSNNTISIVDVSAINDYKHLKDEYEMQVTKYLDMNHIQRIDQRYQVSVFARRKRKICLEVKKKRISDLNKRKYRMKKQQQEQNQIVEIEELGERRLNRKKLIRRKNKELLDLKEDVNDVVVINQGNYYTRHRKPENKITDKDGNQSNCDNSQTQLNTDIQNSDNKVYQDNLEQIKVKKEEELQLKQQVQEEFVEKEEEEEQEEYNPGRKKNKKQKKGSKDIKMKESSFLKENEKEQQLQNEKEEKKVQDDLNNQVQIENNQNQQQLQQEQEGNSNTSKEQQQIPIKKQIKKVKKSISNKKSKVDNKRQNDQQSLSQNEQKEQKETSIELEEKIQQNQSLVNEDVKEQKQKLNKTRKQVKQKIQKKIQWKRLAKMKRDEEQARQLEEQQQTVLEVKCLENASQNETTLKESTNEQEIQVENEKKEKKIQWKKLAKMQREERQAKLEKIKEKIIIQENLQQESLKSTKQEIQKPEDNSCNVPKQHKEIKIQWKRLLKMQREAKEKELQQQASEEQSQCEQQIKLNQESISSKTTIKQMKEQQEEQKPKILQKPLQPLRQISKKKIQWKKKQKMEKDALAKQQQSIQTTIQQENLINLGQQQQMEQQNDLEQQPIVKEKKIQWKKLLKMKREALERDQGKQLSEQQLENLKPNKKIIKAPEQRSTRYQDQLKQKEIEAQKQKQRSQIQKDKQKFENSISKENQKIPKKNVLNKPKQLTILCSKCSQNISSKDQEKIMQRLKKMTKNPKKLNKINLNCEEDCMIAEREVEFDINPEYFDINMEEEKTE